ncbi:hypothetical protein JYK00_03695 [Thermosipho ferrireducens]|uniref:ABC transporter permease n=2 Tax=Thermosipho ferrireducens TaxID=2571116 RepID=A0ABX7S8H2_9BACT|nr:hypothetical protein JYK00_03695 [Thermosipho ferrireducens]
MEIYYEKELKEKLGSWFIFLLLLFIPNYTTRMFFTFFLIINMLPSDVKHKKDRLLYYLPFAKGEIFIYSFLFLIFAVSVTHFISYLFVTSSFTTNMIILLKSINFSSAIFAISMLSVSFGLDNVGIPILFIIADLIIGDLGSTQIGPSFNPYALISPTHQGNIFLSLLLSILLVWLAYKSYVKRSVN